MEGCRLGKCIALGCLRQVIPCHHASFTKLFHPQSPFLSFCLFFSTSFLFSVTYQLSEVLAGHQPFYWFPPPSMYWNIIQLRDVASMKGTYVLKINHFFYWSNIFFQICWFACEVHRVFRVHARPHVHLPCFPCCTTWKITPRWTSAEDHACTMSRYSWGQRLACSFACKRAGELTRWLQPSVPP